MDIVLDEREEEADERSQRMRLQNPPLYALVSMKRTKDTSLDGLELGSSSSTTESQGCST